MTPQDEVELSRLTNMLRDIDAQLRTDSPLREGLKKSGFALHIVFMHGLRSELDATYKKIGDIHGGGPGWPNLPADSDS